MSKLDRITGETSSAGIYGGNREEYDAALKRARREKSGCPECDGTGLVEDPSACGDPEHCEGWMPCPCGCKVPG